MDTETTSPAPPTFVMRTRLKYEWPLTVNLIPPVFLHATLQNKHQPEQNEALDSKKIYFHFLASLLSATKNQGNDQTNKREMRFVFHLEWKRGLFANLFVIIELSS